MKSLLCLAVMLFCYATLTGQTEVEYLAIVDEDVQYYETNPASLKREPVNVDRKIGLMFSKPIFAELYRKMEERPFQYSPATIKAYDELARLNLISLIYLEQNQSGEFLMLRGSQPSAEFQQKSALFIKTIQGLFKIRLKLVKELPLPALKFHPGPIAGIQPSWTILPETPILRAQSQAQTLAVTKVPTTELAGAGRKP